MLDMCVWSERSVADSLQVVRWRSRENPRHCLYTCSTWTPYLHHQATYWCCRSTGTLELPDRNSDPPVLLQSSANCILKAMILRKAGAALAVGCTMVVKPSPETPLSVLTLGYLALQAGFPPGVFNVLTTSLENTPSLSEALCRHELVRKVTFTGSTRIGKLVAKICSDGLKKTSMELGGNSPFLVFEDADLEQAANGNPSTQPTHR
jgi:delta 1-pyrroline-5-carboxylate dehydrogenase